MPADGWHSNSTSLSMSADVWYANCLICQRLVDQMRLGNLHHQWSASIATILRLTIPVVLALALIGCEGGSATPTPASSSNQPAPPVKIVCLPDKTASTHWTRVQQVTVEDFDPLIELVCRRGGELAVGLIRDSSNRGLLRLLVPQPPEAPVEPDRRMNPFLLAELQAAYTKKMRAYQEDLNQQRTRVEEAVSEFSEQLETLLAQPANAQRTDVWGAITRGELFMGEPDDAWKVEPRKYVIAVTDGLDNVRKQKVEMRSGARLLMVNSSASLGDLAALEPVRFESVSSAVQYLLSHEGR